LACNGYFSYACSSGACAILDTKVHCIPAVASSASLPTICADETSCGSDSFIVDGVTYSLTGNCECGYNREGNAYCTLRPGDSIFQKYIQIYKKWVASSKSLKCNTVRRDDDNCIRSVWNSDDYEHLLYYESYIAMYPQLQNNDACVKALFTNTFYEEQDDLDDDDDSAIWLAFSAVVALALN
jgi:hypothetical protein